MGELNGDVELARGQARAVERLRRRRARDVAPTVDVTARWCSWTWTAAGPLLPPVGVCPVG